MKTKPAYRWYRRKDVAPIRRYVPGEDLTGVSIAEEFTPELGGMIIIDPSNPDDRLYISKAYFEKHYELIKD